MQIVFKIIGAQRIQSSFQVIIKVTITNKVSAERFFNNKMKHKQIEIKNFCHTRVKVQKWQARILFFVKPEDDEGRDPCPFFRVLRLCSINCRF
jgi:hypothetical protein